MRMMMARLEPFESLFLAKGPRYAPTDLEPRTSREPGTACVGSVSRSATVHSASRTLRCIRPHVCYGAFGLTLCAVSDRCRARHARLRRRAIPRLCRWRRRTFPCRPERRQPPVRGSQPAPAR